MKNKNLIIIVEAVIIVILLFLYLGSGKSGKDTSTVVMEESPKPAIAMIDPNEALEKENNALHDYIDSLALVIHDLKDQSVTKNAEKKPSAQEAEIFDLINKVHDGWYQMSINNDPEELLKYFMPKHTTSEVRIDLENLPHIEKHNTADLKEHLNALIAPGDVEIRLVKPKVYHTFIRDNIFTTMFLVELKVYRNKTKIVESTVLTTMSGEKYQGNEWRVGNLNWIEFEYFDIFRES